MRDHARLCEGREYTCTCGYDAERDAVFADLLAAAQELLNVGVLNPTGSVKVTEAVSSLRSAVSKAEASA